jgi:hypothetical protein
MSNYGLLHSFKDSGVVTDNLTYLSVMVSVIETIWHDTACLKYAIAPSCMYHIRF